MAHRLSIRLVLLTLSFLLTPAVVTADQTDTRLDALFHTLKTSSIEAERQKAESDIWKIWYESGNEKVDQLMAEARLVAQAGEFRAAELLYTEVIELAPDFSEGWNRRATTRFYMHDFDGSLDDIQQTLRLEPRHFGAIWGLGMILGAQGKFPEAIAAFKKLLEIKPNAQDATPRIELLKKEMRKGAV